MGRPPTKPAPPLGQRLAAIRTARGLSQEEFATELGISRPLLGYYERVAKNPSLEVLQGLAEKLGLSVSELVDVDAETGPKRSKRGPKSKLEERFEKVRALPKREQDLLIRFIDALLAGAAAPPAPANEKKKARKKASPVVGVRRLKKMG